jgi:DNA-binding PadR family transcriptional regulator
MSLKHAILGFLSIAPLTGYELKKSFDNSVQHFWSADQSQIYRTLEQIVEAGWAEVKLVEQQARPNRKVYHITKPGRAELRRWLVAPLIHREEHDPFLIQLFFAGNLPDAEVEALLERETPLHAHSLPLRSDSPAIQPGHATLASLHAVDAGL